MIVIEVCGNHGSGKDTAGELLQKATLATGMVHLTSFAKPLKEEVAKAFELNEEDALRLLWGAKQTKERATGKLQLFRCLDQNFVNMVYGQDPDWSAPRSPREILRHWGTDYRRTQDIDYWVKAMLHHLNQRNSPQGGLTPPLVTIITDLRFENELTGIRNNYRTLLWKIERPEVDNKADDSHSSETQWPHMKHDAVIVNDKTMNLFALKLAIAFRVAVFR